MNCSNILNKHCTIPAPTPTQIIRRCGVDGEWGRKEERFWVIWTMANLNFATVPFSHCNVAENSWLSYRNDSRVKWEDLCERSRWNLYMWKSCNEIETSVGVFTAHFTQCRSSMLHNNCGSGSQCSQNLKTKFKEQRREKARVGCSERIALKHVYYQG